MPYPQLPAGVTPRQFFQRSRRVQLRGPRGLGSMGFVAPFAGSVQPQMNSIAQQLQQTAAQIQANNQLIIQGNQAGLDMTDANTQNVQAQKTNEQAISEFTTIYRAVYGTVPPGLSGLGQFDPVSLLTIGGVTAAIGIVAALAYDAYQYSLAAQTAANAKMVQANTTATAETNSTSLSQQAAAAYAAGNQALGDQLSALATQQASVAQAGVTPPPAGFDLGSFLADNWPYLLGGVGVLWLVKKL
jgi:hypothetical protein